MDLTGWGGPYWRGVDLPGGEWTSHWKGVDLTGAVWTSTVGCAKSYTTVYSLLVL